MSVGDKIGVVRNFIGVSCWSMVYMYFMRPTFLRLQTNASGREHTSRMSPKYGKVALKS